MKPGPDTNLRSMLWRAERGLYDVAVDCIRRNALKAEVVIGRAADALLSVVDEERFYVEVAGNPFRRKTRKSGETE